MTFKVLSCGSNGSCQLGIRNADDQDTLQVCSFETGEGKNAIHKTIDSKPVKIKCGGNHTLVLLENGDCYSCGDNSNGQCGFKDPLDNISYFKRVPFLNNSKWVDIAAGWEFSLLLNDLGELFVCGYGPNGELGLGRHKSKSLELDPLSSTSLVKLSFQFSSPVKSLMSSIHNCLVICQNSDIYIWGNNKKGQFFDLRNEKNKSLKLIWEPKKMTLNIDNTFNSFKFGLSRDFISILKIANDNDKIRYSIDIQGKDNFYIQKSVNDLQEIPNDDEKSKLDILSMWSSIHIITKEFNNEGFEGVVTGLQSFGNNSHGQLPSTQDLSNYRITDVSVGSEHGLFLTSTDDGDNKVYAWGWGEHGNCGKHTKEDKSHQEDVTFDYFNIIYQGSDKIVLIQGGSATSWIVIEK
ncbi:hypothetical protein BVG19_g2101 [[Candida] boidinii]|nr:hypothetical protein BVG19_g2101 [[Candida] boidinii]OWB48858.1 hypothetical protein B5S27_g395 [[Candida] boidinii]OWB82154.1 hypothetical protein B5S33_g776 [[Candida] boidinii]